MYNDNTQKQPNLPCTNFVQTSPMQTEGELFSRLKKLILEKRTIRYIRDNFYPQASLPAISRAVKGALPKKLKGRKSLNLIGKEKIEVCKGCGKVHIVVKKGCKGTFAQRMGRSGLTKDGQASVLAIYEFLVVCNYTGER